MEKKQSGLGIAGFVLSILGCTGFIGFIFSIISLFVDKDKKRGVAIAGLVIGAVWSFFGFLFVLGLFATDSSGYTTKSNSSDKQLDILLCQDENVRIYLDHIKNGQIFLRYCNDSDDNINIQYKDLTINDTRYYESFFVEEVYSHDEDVVKLNLYDKEGSQQQYDYQTGKIKGIFSYYKGGIGFTTELSFDDTDF